MKNREHMEKHIKELKKSMYDIFLHILDERVSNVNNKMQGNNENVEEINIESQNHDYSLLLRSTSSRHTK
jgi:hypothetical protein